MAADIGVKIGLDGEAEFRRSLKLITQQSKELSSEFKAVTSAFDGGAKSEEQLAAETEVLTKQIDNQKAKLALLTDNYKAAVKRQKELEDEAAKLAREYGESSEQATKAASAVDRQAQAVSRSKTDINNATTALNKMEGQLSDLSNQADKGQQTTERLSDGFTVMKGVVSDLASSAIQAAIGAVKDFIGSLFDLSEATQEYRQMQATLTGSANAFGYSVEYVKEQYAEFYRYLGDDQMATNAITNLLGLGTSVENVSNLAQAAVAVWSAYGDSIPIESLTESMNESAQVAKVTGVLADALNWAGISEDEFNAKLEACNTTQERADLIADTLNDTYADSKIAYDQLTGSMQDANTANLELKDAQAQLGQAMEPVNTLITNAKTAFYEALIPAIQDAIPKLTEFVSGLDFAAIAEGVASALETLVGVIKFLSQYGELVVATILAISGAIGVLNLVLNANPIGLIITAIGLVITIIVKVIAHIDEIKAALSGAWDFIKSVFGAIGDFFAGIWDGIKTAFNGVVEFFTGLFSSASEGIQTAWSGITGFFGGIWDGITGAFSAVGDFFGEQFETGKRNIETAWSTVSSWASGAWDGIKSAFSTVGGFFKDQFSAGVNNIQSAWSGITGFFSGVWDKISSTFSGLATKALDWGKDMIQGFINGIKNMIGKVTDAVKSVGNAIKNFLHFSRPDKGPLRDYETWMPDFMSGLAKGIYDNSYLVQDAIDAVSGQMVMDVNATGAASGSVTNLGGITITVNAAEGQDATQIADAVLTKLQRRVTQREAVFA